MFGSSFSFTALAPLTGVAAVLFTLTWLVLGRVSTGFTLFEMRVEPYNWMAQPVSGLGLSETAPVMNSVFVLTGMLLGLGGVGLVAGLSQVPAWERWLVGAVLMATPVGIGVCGLFTLERIIPHAAGFLLAVSAPVLGFYLLGRLLAQDVATADLSRWTWAAALITLALLPVWFWSFDPVASGQGRGYAGLVQRIMITEVLGVFAWLGWAIPHGLGL